MTHPPIPTRRSGAAADPAEVSGDGTTRHAVTRRWRTLARCRRYRRDTLDERLSEEEPDRTSLAEQDEAGESGSESGDDDIALVRGERDLSDTPDDDDESAEDAAVHVIPD